MSVAYAGLEGRERARTQGQGDGGQQQCLLPAALKVGANSCQMHLAVCICSPDCMHAREVLRSHP